jgi:long-chain acyl-CoA synthetase
MNLADILAVVARAHPHAPALSLFEPGDIHGSPRLALTYAAFETEVARTAAGVQKLHNLAPGARLAIAMENCPEFLVALFAAWRAGLVAVPINAKLHPLEMAWIMAHADVRLMLATPKIADGLTALGSALPRVPILATGTRDFAALSAHDDTISRAPDTGHLVERADDAWLFYTSGTTGRPKGAMLTHANLLFACHAYYADISAVDVGSAILHAAALSHGSGLYGLAHVLRGSHNIIHAGFEPRDVLETFSRFERVAMFAAPTMVYRLIADPALAGIPTPGLEALIYGGAPMYRANLEQALTRFGPGLFHLYGQGESPMTITGLGMRAHALRPDKRDTAGIARTGVAVRVVDDEGRDVEPGALGEVVTRSACVMRGYLDNQEATRAALRGGWLWTGDIGHLDRDGFLTLADRSKDLIISGGANIYPREIEEVLLTAPNVAECAVVGEPHPDWGERVVAFVVAARGAPIDPPALDRLCLDRIARFKRPQRYEVVDSLPKNNYGKVLKTELRNRLASEDKA